MQRLLFFIALIACCLSAAAKIPQYRYAIDEADALSIAQQEFPWSECVLKSMAKAPNVEKVSVDIKTTRAGELKELLGDRLLTIDALSVEGPINNDDYHTMWSATFHGLLTELDLGKAIPESEIIPAGTFFRNEEQLDSVDHLILIIRLKKIVLPPTIREIGEGAFQYAASLANIQFPDSLETIKKNAFCACESLTPSSFVFPDKLKTIGYQAFRHCKKLAGEIVLPSSIERIEGRAFFCDNIQKLNFPESLKFIGGLAFSMCNLQGDIVLPDNCRLDSLGEQFYGNCELKSVKLPACCTLIPKEIFFACYALESVSIPQGVKVIDEEAFANCRNLKSIELPEGLEAIKAEALRSCVEIKELVLPSTLKTLGSESFMSCSRVGSITCKAEVPPTYDTAAPGTTPFGGIDIDIEVTIPIGSKDRYASAWGWKQFTNFNEREISGIEILPATKPTGSAVIYDLQGRRVVAPIPGRVYIHDGKKFIQH